MHLRAKMPCPKWHLKKQIAAIGQRIGLVASNPAPSTFEKTVRNELV
jgi:energy-coupling factor transporter ATP-binding protein EcfA2